MRGRRRACTRFTIITAGTVGAASFANVITRLCERYYVPLLRPLPIYLHVSLSALARTIVKQIWLLPCLIIRPVRLLGLATSVHARIADCSLRPRHAAQTRTLHQRMVGPVSRGEGRGSPAPIHGVDKVCPRTSLKSDRRYAHRVVLCWRQSRQTQCG